MRVRCTTCKGKAFIKHEETCPKCGGFGSQKIQIGVGKSQKESQEKCRECGGKGKLEDQETCPGDCEEGYFNYCDFCNETVTEGEDLRCKDCTKEPYVVKLIQPLDRTYLDGKRALLAAVTKVEDEDVYVQIGDRALGIWGKFKTKFPRRYKLGKTIGIRTKRKLETKPNWRNHVSPLTNTAFKVKIVSAKLPERLIKEFKSGGIDNQAGAFTAQILSVREIPNGPTFFRFLDRTGETIQGTAFGGANKRAYPKYDRHSIVKVSGIMDDYKGNEQFFIYALRPIAYEERQEFLSKLSKISEIDGKNLEELNLSHESEVMTQLQPKILEAVKKIRKLILLGHRIVLRYHSPCVDGVAAAYILDYTIRKYLQFRGHRVDELRHLIRRIPQQSPVYEISDAIRDISFSLDGPGNQQLPVVVLIDIGSSTESLLSYKLAKKYEMPIIVIDHHILDSEVSNEVTAIVNPEEFNIEYLLSASMLTFEIARLLYPHEDISANLCHLAILGGMADKVKDTEIKLYLDLFETIGEEMKLTQEELKDMALAIDYLLFKLRFSDGGEVIRKFLQIGANKTDDDKVLTKEFAELAKSLIKSALAILEKNEEKEEVNKLVVRKYDLDKAPKHNYPSHSSMISHLHEDKVSDAEKAVTLGYGADYLIYRSSNLDKNLSDIIKHLQEKQTLANITGGGHGHAGSMRFLAGSSNQVIANIIEFIK